GVRAWSRDATAPDSARGPWTLSTAWPATATGVPTEVIAKPVAGMSWALALPLPVQTKSVDLIVTLQPTEVPRGSLTVRSREPVAKPGVWEWERACRGGAARGAVGAPPLVICWVTVGAAATAGRTRDELTARAPTKPRIARGNRERMFMTGVLSFAAS